MASDKELLAEFYGRDVEEAYAEAFGGRVRGGINDNGRDIETGVADIPYLQVKSSWKGVLSFLAISVDRKQFIPIVMGEPGSREEMLKSIREYGGWIGMDEPDRQKHLEYIAKARAYCKA